jgi:hypothetical protein
MNPLAPILPEEIIIIILSYKELNDVGIIQSFDYINNFAFKLVAEKYPKLFGLLNNPKIIGDGKLFESWNDFIEELIKFQNGIGGFGHIIFNHLLNECEIMSDSQLINVLTDKFTEYFNVPDYFYLRDDEYRTKYIKNILKSIHVLEYIYAWIAPNEFINKIIIIICQDNLDDLILSNHLLAQGKYFYKNIIKLGYKPSDQQVGEILLGELIRWDIFDRVDEPLLKYLNADIFFSLCTKDIRLAKKILMSQFNIDIINDSVMYELAGSGNIDLIQLILNHKDFRVTASLLDIISELKHYTVLKLLLTHPTSGY